eukprot:Phypoly_transcript_04546.p1 GENE.Phypoly_transcript_04546~~Phypoly_transcript_04546.p1  ORF type:complete len:598 (+),score=80.00 Phypoly_transcript_04546:350-2143(+)
MFDFLFSTKNELDKATSTPYNKNKRRTSLPDPDPTVDIAYMYGGITVRKEYILEGYFTTCKSHRDTILNQELAFAKLYSEEGFALFIANPKRTIALPLHRKIKACVLYGIPPRFRSRMWQAMVGLESRQFMQYSDLFTMRKNEDIVAQIKLDVTRTVPAVEDPVFIEKLTRVLIAYSIRNPRLGYCQSMNFLAGSLLLFMEEESAFWMLVYMVEDLLPNYFVPSMSGFHVDANVFEWLVYDNLPELHRHFQRVNLSYKILSSPWFLCLFVNDFPAETAFLVWDNLMLEGIIVIFEVALAVLHLLKDEILEMDDQVEITQHIRKRTLEIQDPRLLLKHWPRLDKIRTLVVRRKMRQKEEEEAMKNIVSTVFTKLALRTHFASDDLLSLWAQYKNIDPYLDYECNGLDPDQFAQFVGGTFSEWWVDEELVRRLFAMADVNRDGIVDFGELVALLSVICRGTLKEVVTFNFQLFDTKSKGWIDSLDLSRMFQSIYAMFKRDSIFQQQIHKIVDRIYSKYAKMGTISLEDFEHIVKMQPQIMEKFKTRNSAITYNPRQTFYYWMFEPERPERNSEIIFFSLDPKATFKQSQVPLPVLFIRR